MYFTFQISTQINMLEDMEYPDLTDDEGASSDSETEYAISIPYLDVQQVSGYSLLHTLHLTHVGLVEAPASYPPNMVKLQLSGNRLTSFTTALPVTTTDVDVSSNWLTTIPEGVLNPGLIVLKVGQNYLESLPTFPRALVELYCGRNQLRTLPHLPNGLDRLYAFENKLTSLPCGLPGCLAYLFVSENYLTKLPIMPYGMIELVADRNFLESLPHPMPPTITMLSVQDNKLTVLPPMWPALKYLCCCRNLLTVLPQFPLDAQIIYISAISNRISRLSHYRPPHLIDLFLQENSFVVVQEPRDHDATFWDVVVTETDKVDAWKVHAFCTLHGFNHPERFLKYILST